MFRNYFKTAIRSLRANKIYSMITVAGLGVGIAVCLVIFVFIGYEQSFDTFHSKQGRIFRVLTKDVHLDKKIDSGSGVPFALPRAMENDLRDWKTSAVFALDDMQLMTLDKAGNTEKKFKEHLGVYLVEPAFFSIFDLTWLAGDPGKSLVGNSAAVLTRSTAERYFGDWKQAMGRTIKVQNNRLVTVTGILADPPNNSDFRLIKVIFPYPSGHFAMDKDWVGINQEHECYTLLPAGMSVATANRQLDQLSKKYRSPNSKTTQVVQALAEVHFARMDNFSGRTISVDRIRSLWLIAGFILLIACVNFINISTAQAVNRAREVGVRKVLGSSRGQLTGQFMLEAFLLVVVGVVLAVVLTSVLVGPVSKLLDMPVSYVLFSRTPVLLFLALTTIGVTLLAGFYPALVLSGFKPISALKTKLAARSNSGINLRRGLVVLQFVIAQALIIGTLLVLRQMNYFSHQSMGFNKEALVTVPFAEDSVSKSKLSYLRNRLLAEKGIREVSFNNAVPSDQNNWWMTMKFDHSRQNTNFNMIYKMVDADYLSTYGLQLTAGRNLINSDSVREFMINETLMKKLGYADAQAILNREINFADGWCVGKIVGVVRDFHPTSLKDSLAPLFLLNFKDGFNTAGIKLDGKDMPATVAAIAKIWNETYPNFVFEYQFLDEKIASFYKDEAKLSLFYKVFASIAIFLSCLGLYGLASFMAAQRVKEVGIRKVLGATTAHIIYLFSKEFVLLIGIAFVISAPIAWYFVNEWLQQYVYRISISGWVFVTGGLLALLVALATVSFQAFKAAVVNPVKNLRTE